MKVLFLDVDGVLNSEQSAGWLHYEWVKAGSKLPRNVNVFGFNPVETNNLRRLMAEVPDMKIVLGSCWRIGRDLEGCQQLLHDNDLDGSRVIGRTGFSCSKEQGGRGAEIQNWLDAAEVRPNRFVILDDDSDMGHLTKHLVKTDFRTGLTLLHVAEIKKRLE